MKRVSDRRDNDCTQSAGSLPKIELEFLMYKPYSEQLYILTAGDLNADNQQELNAQFNKLFVHEAIHRIFYELDIKPREHPDEQFTEYLEEVVMLQFQTDDTETSEADIFGLKSATDQTQKRKIPEAVKYDM